MATSEMPMHFTRAMTKLGKKKVDFPISNTNTRPNQSRSDLCASQGAKNRFQEKFNDSATSRLRAGTVSVVCKSKEQPCALFRDLIRTEDSTRHRIAG